MLQTLRENGVKKSAHQLLHASPVTQDISTMYCRLLDASQKKENIPVDLENKTQYPCFNERKGNEGKKREVRGGWGERKDKENHRRKKKGDWMEKGASAFCYTVTSVLAELTAGNLVGVQMSPGLSTGLTELIFEIREECGRGKPGIHSIFFPNKIILLCHALYDTEQRNINQLLCRITSTTCWPMEPSGQLYTKSGEGVPGAFVQASAYGFAFGQFFARSPPPGLEMGVYLVLQRVEHVPHLVDFFMKLL
ncbi:hypothetical protein DBR06_SOUSAS410007 [Sousa chinensis]|uniref:Uncharacterized protein n=1 Tax=Sousa chinensis TaxID=103600 RepID=A0A484GFK1_SOUCH|nr:hypothetical protein DBR06_SOUSAS410007 [Sousa chinensis]